MIKYMLTPRETPVSWLCAVIAGVCIADGLQVIAMLSLITAWAANFAGYQINIAAEKERDDG